MSEEPKIIFRVPRLRAWQRVFLAALFLVPLALSSTVFNSLGAPEDTERAEAAEAAEAGAEQPTPEELGWEELYAYVVTEDGQFDVPFYNEALAEVSRCGRGTYVRLESWEPFVSDNGGQFCHIYLDGTYGYIAADALSDDQSDIIQETQVYVRTSVNLLQEPDSVAVGSLARKGEMLRVVGYDYLRPDGMVHMYEVKLGTEIGWIQADYVVDTYAKAQEYWNNENDVYSDHVWRGDNYGGGNAADLDYWPHEKGDFSEEGNVMPESVYALYIPTYAATPAGVEAYLDMAKGTAVNTFVVTVFGEGELAYDSSVISRYGLLDKYSVPNTSAEFGQAMKKLQDAGYYTVARIVAFNDDDLALAYPEWAITDRAGQPKQINGSYWPSLYCREVWELKAALALEAVDKFGFGEVQFDYVRFPDYIQNYEEEGSVDLKNTYDESKAQALQRFLIYATDLIHAHGAYVAADVFGETSNNYVAPYGQYWDAISTVVDVICGMPYPDHYSSYYRNGEYYQPYRHPYTTLHDWGIHVAMRQAECSSPAIVRTWMQTWDDEDYSYDEKAIQREIVALYDLDITGGYMPWHSYGSLPLAENIGNAIDFDYYELYLQAEEEGILLSELLDVDTSQ